MALGYRSLVFDISANVAKLTQDLNQVTTKFQQMGNAVNKVFGAISITGAAYSIKALVDNVTAAGEEFLKLSKQTGLTVEEVQKLQFTAEQSETDFGALTLAISRMNKSIYELKKPTSETAKELHKLGFTMCFMIGGTVVLERSMGFLEPMIRKIETEGVTGFPNVPSIGAMLLKLKNLRTERFASLRYISSTGAAWPAAHIRQFRRLLHGVKIFSMYGLTECKRTSFLPPELIDEMPGSAGSAMPNSEAFVVDGNGDAVPPGETGELVVRSSNVMQGYWNDRETTERVFRAGRFPADRRLYTGDWFRLGEDGSLYFAGRRDDLSKSYGRRVGPREVEEAAACLGAKPWQVSRHVLLPALLPL